MCLSYVVWFCVLNIVVVTLGSELESHGSYSRSSELALQRVKRPLNNDYHRHSTGGYDSESKSAQNISPCSPKKLSPQTNSIIRSTASTKNGAKYLSFHEDVKSNIECFNLCCQNPDCDTSVFEEKDSHRCYLFDCQGRCFFKQHGNYTVWEVQHQPAPPIEEEELAHLHSDNSNVNNDNDQRPLPEPTKKEQENKAEEDQSMKSPMPVEKSKTEHIAPHTAGLSEHCLSDISCEDPNASCFAGTCHCKEGFYNKNGLCRKVCPETDFECVALGTTGRGPECIPRKQMCDSYLQCADGSDEYNCDKQASNSGRGPWNNAASSAWMTGQSVNRNNNVMNGQPMVQGTRPVLQEGAQELPVYDPSENYDISTPPEEPPENPRNSLPTDGNLQQTNVLQNNFMNPFPNVRPNSVLAQPAKPSMNNRKQLTAKNNQPLVDSYRNTNPNPVYSQSPNINAKDNVMNNNQNYNQNNAFKDTPSGNNPSINARQRIKMPSKSYSGRQDEPAQPVIPVRNHDYDNIKESSHRMNPSNVAYSESGPFRERPVNNVRNQNTKVKENQQPETQRYNSQSSQSQLLSSSGSNLSPHIPAMSKVDQDRNDQKDQQSSQQIITGRIKNPLPSPSSQSKSLSDQSNIYKNQQNSLLTTKTKVASRVQPPPVRPNYQGSSLLSSSSSSSHQPSRQSWLDSNPYVSYGNQRQRQQVQPSRNSQYYDPSQYFSQYNSDSIDGLQPSLLGDTGSQDDFSQFGGGSYMDRQKSLNRMPYPVDSGNIGYVGYPDSAYNSQYNPSNRYNYGGDYGNSNYQDTDFYPPVRNTKGYQSSGLYEDVQSNSALPSSGVKESKGSLQPGDKIVSVEDNKPSVDSKSASTSDTKGSESKGIIPKLKEIASSKGPISESVKNKSKKVGSTKELKSNLTQATTKKPHTSVSHNKVFVSREKVIIASSGSEAEGLIIALCLGLAFTLILIVLLGCRLRNMKHRLRKGRPLNSNEADYLINGMYL